jgi:adenylosuccinate synthase
MEHLSNHARAVLAEGALHMRACAILGVKSHTETTAEKYAAALIQADKEGAGKAYVDEVARRAGVRATEAAHESEGVHHAAVSYLRATGKNDYTQDEYIAAVGLVQEVS